MTMTYDVRELLAGLRALGVRSGQDVLVHSFMDQSIRPGRVSGLMWLMRTVPYRWTLWRLAMEIAQRHPGNDHAVIRRTLSEVDLHGAFWENEA
jgi:hypothetical protein